MLISTKITGNKNQQFQLVKRFVSYVQGQEPEPKIREYFYYIDHQGMVRTNQKQNKNDF